MKLDNIFNADFNVLASHTTDGYAVVNIAMLQITYVNSCNLKFLQYYVINFSIQSRPLFNIGCSYIWKEMLQRVLKWEVLYFLVENLNLFCFPIYWAKTNTNFNNDDGCENLNCLK